MVYCTDFKKKEILNKNYDFLKNMKIKKDINLIKMQPKVKNIASRYFSKKLPQHEYLKKKKQKGKWLPKDEHNQKKKNVILQKHVNYKNKQKKFPSFAPSSLEIIASMNLNNYKKKNNNQQNAEKYLLKQQKTQEYLRKKYLKKLDYQKKRREFEWFRKLCMRRMHEKYFGRKPFRYKSNFNYARLLKKFIFHVKPLRTRFLYKFILVTKHAFIQYYRKFKMKTFKMIYKLYRQRKLLLSKFEKFVNFFEFRLPCVLVRIRYTLYLLYSNIVILTGQIRINGKVIIYCDYQAKLYDLIEISYKAFFRHFFKRFLFRHFAYYRKRGYGNVFRFKRPHFFYFFNKYLTQLPTWLYFSLVRVRKSVKAFYSLLVHPTNSYFVQYKNVLATIIFKLATRFSDRRFSYFITKKQMKFFSNFCLKIK